MKVAVVGSRSLNVPDLQKYLPHQLTEIVSGGAAGVDRCAREYAQQNQIPLTEFCRSTTATAVPLPSSAMSSWSPTPTASSPFGTGSPKVPSPPSNTPCVHTRNCTSISSNPIYK